MKAIGYQRQKNVPQPLKCRRLAAPQRRAIDLRTIARPCKQADDTLQGGINSADAVLLSVYE